MNMVKSRVITTIIIHTTISRTKTSLTTNSYLFISSTPTRSTLAIILNLIINMMTSTILSLGTTSSKKCYVRLTSRIITPTIWRISLITTTCLRFTTTTVPSTTVSTSSGTMTGSSLIALTTTPRCSTSTQSNQKLKSILVWTLTKKKIARLPYRQLQPL